MAEFVFTKVLLKVQAEDVEGALAEYRKLTPGLTKKNLGKKIASGEIVVKKVN